jgi:hypothetical protein
LEEKLESYIVTSEQPLYIESEEKQTIFEIQKSLLIEMND